MDTPIRSYTLSELLGSVRKCVETTYATAYWIRAEISSLSVQRSSGHCYLELEEKREGRSDVVARCRANIWSYNYQSIRAKFEAAGLPALSAGVSILCLVRLVFHEVYGFSLQIQDVDTDYSLGEIARQRQETIKRLEREGVMADNKGHELPRPLQRLAIISSPTAAGYGDFIKQLHRNSYGLRFYTALYIAQMQGEGTGASIIRALERIALSLEHFDAVVIIRGGGSVSELRAFDDYELAYFCTQFPLPIISGIGHDRDVSVLDLVAHTSLKTPTAVAEFLVQAALDEYALVEDLRARLLSASSLLQGERRLHLTQLAMRLPSVATRRLQREQSCQHELRQALHLGAQRLLAQQHQSLARKMELLPYLGRGHIAQRLQRLQQETERLKSSTKQCRQQLEQELSSSEKFIRLAHPENTLRRGFALIRRGGEVLGARSTISAGDLLEIQLAEQRITAEVKP